MDTPESFLTRINQLCIPMTHAGRRKEAAQRRRQRKQTLRQMDRLVGIVRTHARRHRQLFDQQWQQTSWTRPQAEPVLRRMDQVLEQLPQARQQARQRILDEQPVANEDKILSLYEPEVRVIVRQKPGAEVEFSNTLFLAENPQGLIIDWELFGQSAPADSKLLPRSMGRMERVYGPQLRALAGDRGFDSSRRRRVVASTFLSAGAGDFPVAISCLGKSERESGRPGNTGLESPAHPQARKPAPLPLGTMRHGVALAYLCAPLAPWRPISQFAHQSHSNWINC